jgi:tetrahydromethanopterin S-methyltransferase subunit E
MSTPPAYSANAPNTPTTITEIPIEIPLSNAIKIPAATRRSNSTAWWLIKRLALLTFLCFVAGAIIVASFHVGMTVGIRVGVAASSSPEVTQFLSDMFSNSKPT